MAPQDHLASGASGPVQAGHREERACCTQQLVRDGPHPCPREGRRLGVWTSWDPGYWSFQKAPEFLAQNEDHGALTKHSLDVKCHLDPSPFQPPLEKLLFSHFPEEEEEVEGEEEEEEREEEGRKLTCLLHAAQGPAQTDFRALIDPLRKLPKGTRTGGTG